MNKEGFTLIEIIAVIAVLALILLIIVPSVNNILKNSKKNLNDEQIAQIESAASNWGATNLYLKEDGKPSQNSVTIDTLRKTGYLEDKTVKSLIENEELSNETKICITYSKNQYIYELDGEC